ncbi:hypothetical protein [Pseudodesulfovibrio sp.]|uniref:hypothetical protein n=1 Tax=unclassified Pseudodesulfovibrio TaxID=2661612 RepID=UPI003B0023CC
MYDDDLIDGWMGQGWTPDPANGAGALLLTPRESAFLSLPPELFFASELFQGRYVRSRARVHDYPIQSTCSHRTLLYTGERLDQFDQDVFLACAARFPRQTSSAPCALKIDLRSLAREVLKRAGAADRRRVADSLRRLESGRIKIRDGRFTCYLQPIQKAMFDIKADLCIIELNPEMLRALQGLDNLQGFVQERFRLPKVSMDRWLHGVMHYSDRICIPFAGLPALSGNADALPVQVEESLNRLRGSVRMYRLSMGEGGLEISRNRESGGEKG